MRSYSTDLASVGLLSEAARPGVALRTLPEVRVPMARRGTTPLPTAVEQRVDGVMRGQLSRQHALLVATTGAVTGAFAAVALNELGKEDATTGSRLLYVAITTVWLILTIRGIRATR